MTSTEAIFKDIFVRPRAWRTLLWGGLSMFIFLPYGYFRMISQMVRDHSEQAAPTLTFDRQFWRRMAQAFPLGAFYTLIPLGFAWSFASIFELMYVDFLSPIVWGIASMFSLTVTATALTVVPEDPERYFLGLDFENVLQSWWNLRLSLVLPALCSYGVVALLGKYLYGFGFFIALSVLVRVASAASPRKVEVVYPRVSTSV